jgi:type II restriction enzyme
MNLNLDKSYADGYKSSSQIARVLTESWVKKNSYCPSCGNEYLNSFENNAPVADFICSSCKSEYELKSKKNSFTLKIVDGAYQTMIQRINSENNPHFFFLNYSLQTLTVHNFLVIPNHYFIDNIIEKRKPLSEKAVRAGWVGCNILLQNIPSFGKIFLVKDGAIKNRADVIETWGKTAFLGRQKKETRGWTIEVLKVIENISEREFNLGQVYQFENDLKRRFPNNNFVRDKIRQQLQILRDKGLLEFKGNGLYKKI